MSRFIVIVNPTSANGRTAKTWEKMRKLFPADVQVWHTKAKGHATELTRSALNLGAETIVAVGGDGTINEVVNGFFDGGRAISPDTVLGIIPQGTSSDLRRSLDLPLDTLEAALIVNNGRARSLDVMRVRYTALDGAAALRYGINVVSFGIGGAIATRVNRSRKALGGRASYLIATAIAALGYSGKPVEMTLDHSKRIQARILNVAVGNGQYHGAGMLVCPGAKFDDGSLDVTIIDRMSLAEIVINIGILYNGRIREHPKVQSHQARHIRAESSEKTLIEIDGEAVGQLPLEIEIVPGAIRVLA